MENTEFNINFGNDTPLEQSSTEPEVQEEEVVEESHEEPEEGAEGEAEQPKKVRDPNKTKINQLTRQMYQAQNQAQRYEQELMAMAQENERLRKLSEFSAQTALSSHETAVIEKLERAKELKAKALDVGDVQAQIDADVAIASAVSDYQKLNSWKAEQSFQNQEEPRYQNYQDPNRYNYSQQFNPEVAHKQHIQDWVTDNDWFMPNSPNYDSELRGKVDFLCDKIDAELYRQGRQHEIFSPNYFNVIDQQIQHWQQPTRSNMNAPRSMVSPVRHGAAVRGSTGKAGLGAEEKAWAAKLGVTEDYYKKFKMEEAKKANERMAQQRYR